MANIPIKFVNHCSYRQLLNNLLVCLNPRDGFIEGFSVLKTILKLIPRFFVVHKLWNTRQLWPVDGQTLVVTDLHLAMGNNQNRSSVIAHNAT